VSEALYRKYRSKSLNEVVGQSHITDTLGAALGSGKVSHAYLFTGPRGVGKTSVARILAHAVNKLPYTDESTHIDIIEIDAASNRRIDDIRDLREKVHIAPAEVPYKVYIIDEVHMLTGESFNALLKTLEEPPAHVIFILATTEAHKLPATIISRTQRFHFRPIASKAATEHLAEIAKKEKITVDPDALELIAKHGDGSFRDSISLLDQLAALTGGKITAQEAETLLGIAPGSSVEKIVSELKSGDTATLQQTLSELLEERGVNPHVLTGQLIYALKEAAHDMPGLYSLIDELLEVPKNSQPSLKLTILLLKFASQNKEDETTIAPKAARAHNPALHTVSKTPKEVVSHQQSATSEKTSALSKTQVDNDNLQTAGNQEPFALTAWHEVLAFIRKNNPPLYSVLAKAEPRLKNDELTLVFAYKLHQKKLDDPKYRTKLTRVITDIGYACPKVSTLVDKSAKPPIALSAKANTEPTDETTRSVLDMMGGGEIVNGQQA
jgi:DNA polymerase-3 subunit gamma/tau